MARHSLHHSLCSDWVGHSWATGSTLAGICPPKVLCCLSGPSKSHSSQSLVASLVQMGLAAEVWARRQRAPEGAGRGDWLLGPEGCSCHPEARGSQSPVWAAGLSTENNN